MSRLLFLAVALVGCAPRHTIRHDAAPVQDPATQTLYWREVHSGPGTVVDGRDVGPDTEVGFVVLCNERAWPVCVRVHPRDATGDEALRAWFNELVRTAPEEERGAP